MTKKELKAIQIENDANGTARYIVNFDPFLDLKKPSVQKLKEKIQNS